MEIDLFNRGYLFNKAPVDYGFRTYEETNFHSFEKI